MNVNRSPVFSSTASRTTSRGRFGFSNVSLQPSSVYAPTIPFVLFAGFQLMFAAITPALITGAFAERTDPLPVGTVATLEFLVPGNDIPVRAQCRVAWWHPPGGALVSKVLPAGLGVYMLTNTWLGMVQQVLMERYIKSKSGPSATIEVREKTLGDGGKPTPALGKGKARARG